MTTCSKKPQLTVGSPSSELLQCFTRTSFALLIITTYGSRYYYRVFVISPSKLYVS